MTFLENKLGRSHAEHSVDLPPLKKSVHLSVDIKNCIAPADQVKIINSQTKASFCYIMRPCFYCQMMLLLGTYCQETSSWESNAIVKQYKEVTKLHPDWEDCWFYTAKYYDKIMTNLIEQERPEKRGWVVTAQFCIFSIVLKFSLSVLCKQTYSGMEIFR